MKWLTDLFKTKTTPPGVVKPEPEVRSCSCDTDKYSVCVYPKDVCCEPLENVKKEILYNSYKIFGRLK
jgi:hypothetical protein